MNFLVASSYFHCNKCTYNDIGHRGKRGHTGHRGHTGQPGQAAENDICRRNLFQFTLAKWLQFGPDARRVSQKAVADDLYMYLGPGGWPGYKYYRGPSQIFSERKLRFDRSRYSNDNNSQSGYFVDDVHKQIEVPLAMARHFAIQPNGGGCPAIEVWILTLVQFLRDISEHGYVVRVWILMLAYQVDIFVFVT